MSESNDSLGQGTEFATHRLSRTDTSLEPNSSDDKARGLAMPSDVLDQERDEGAGDRGSLYHKAYAELRPDSPELPRSSDPRPLGDRAGRGINPTSPDTNIRDVLHLDTDDDIEDNVVDDEDFELDTTMGPFSTIDEKGEDRKDDADTSVYIDTAEELSDPDSALASHDSNFQLRETAVVFDERDTSPVIEAEGDFEVVAEVMQSWAVPEDKTALGIEGKKHCGHRNYPDYGRS